MSMRPQKHGQSHGQSAKDSTRQKHEKTGSFTAQQSRESPAPPNKTHHKHLSKSTRTAKDTPPPRSTSTAKKQPTSENVPNNKQSDDGGNYSDELLNRMSKALTHNNWFHGSMPRDEIEEMLVNDGDFLLRKTEVSKHVRYAVTVMNQGRIRHILLTYKADMWTLRELKKPTVTELIEAHVKDKIPVMSDGTLLVNGIPRSPFYILHEHVELKQKLGGGAFADVYAGNWKQKDDTVIEVAIKKLKGMMLKKQRAEFIKEAKMMRKFDHPNIVKVYGVAPQEDPIYIILELAPNGSLRSKLKKHPDTGNNILLNYATDACRGMCYLAGRKVIHRDIAARNCLLGRNDEVKISDFGLSVADRSVLKLDKLKNMPVKWLSPEVIRKGEFTQKSDVWAFGVMVWEVFNHCKVEPFPNETNAQAKVKILSGQAPMTPPDGAPEIVKLVMQLCFIQDPDQRPDFEGVFKLLAPKETPPAAQQFDTYAV